MADPLSVATSVLALATAAMQIGKAISRLRHFGEMPGRIYALRNEISDLEVVLRQVAHALEQGSLEPDDERGSLEPILLRTKGHLADLAQALERVATACEGGKVKAISKSTVWWKEKALFQGFQEDIRSVKATLNLLLAAANSRDIQHIMLELRRVTVVPSTSGHSQGFLNPDPGDHVFPLNTRMNQQFQDLSDRLDTLKKLVVDGRPQGITNPDQVPTSSKGTNTQTLRVIASQRTPCRSWCPCACHVKPKMKLTTPGVVETLLGRLFVGYSGLPVLNKSCDFRGCRDRQNATATMEFWFPWWFVSMNFRFQLTLLPRAGPQFQLSTTRRVADDSQSISYAMKGSIDGLKYLFNQGLAGPRDVSDSRGYTLMRWALYGGMHNYDTVKFLINEGALVDEISYDNVWDFMFRGKVSATQKHELRCITEGGDGDWVEEQNFPLIHRIIFGLSSKPLSTELQENPNAVYTTDAQNRTALDWATARIQLDDMALLIAYGADPNNMDITGRTPVLHAVDSHDVSCLRLILEAGGVPDPVMPKGIFRSSALTATGFAGIPEMLKLLLEHEADPNASNPEGITALHAVARTHNVECALHLLEWGADLNATSSNGRTPLTTAIANNNHPVLRLFVDRCYEYLTTMRFHGPQILRVIAEYADIETFNIIASSNPLKFAYDLNVHNFTTYQEILQKRPDYNEKLSVAFNELINIAKANEPNSRSLDSVVESGFFLSAKASFHSDLSEARSKLDSAFHSPVDSTFHSPISPVQRERTPRRLGPNLIDTALLHNFADSPRSARANFADSAFDVSPTDSGKESDKFDDCDEKESLL